MGVGEQNKSMATGLICVQAGFEAIWGLLPGDMAVLAPVGCRTVLRGQGDGSGVRGGFCDGGMVWYGVVRVGGSWRWPC